MDPVSIVGLVEGSLSLAVQCGSVAKSLNTLAGQYKYAQLTISTMVQNLDIMHLYVRGKLWEGSAFSRAECLTKTSTIVFCRQYGLDKY